jgi:putative membrane protein
LIVFIDFLKPWTFSPSLVLVCSAALVAYLRGLSRLRRARLPISIGRTLSFLLGVGLIYVVMHTRFDYYSQYMFFVHRLQHLVLHHLGPFLIALAAPGPVLALGLPERLKRFLAELWRQPVVHGTYHFLQHPVVAPILFVGLIYFWLTPAIHFDAMLSSASPHLNRYLLMNWSMLIDGLLFWWLILDPRSPEQAGTLALGKRILILLLIMLPQIVLGAVISLSHRALYDVYAVCGRAWPIEPAVDQQIGGLITWIPAAMMSVVAILVVLSRLIGRKGLPLTPPEQQRPSPTTE